MTSIPDSHPRAASLKLREKLVEGVKKGLASEQGLLAHGRGEAFDYLLGEKTHDFALEAIKAASAMLILAKHPVISVNGNVASLAAEEIAQICKACPRIIVEANIFHFTETRMKNIQAYLISAGVPNVLIATEPGASILPGIDHARKNMNSEGIAKADVVIVGLEDGDRCQALVLSGRKTIIVDLNPMSRTAQTADISITDEVTRAFRVLTSQLREDLNIPHEELTQRLNNYKNKINLECAISAIRRGF